MEERRRNREEAELEFEEEERRKEEELKETEQQENTSERRLSDKEVERKKSIEQKRSSWMKQVNGSLDGELSPTRSTPERADTPPSDVKRRQKAQAWESRLKVSCLRMLHCTFI
jgi:hypothetical protein